MTIFFLKLHQAKENECLFKQMNVLHSMKTPRKEENIIMGWYPSVRNNKIYIQSFGYDKGSSNADH